MFGKYITRGNKFVIVEVRMVNEEKAKFHFTETLKTEEEIILPIYMGRRTLKVRFTKFQLVAYAAWLVA